jgi:hypothetical protein
MKHIKLFEEFINEKAYQLTGIYGSKGIIGKILFDFKKQIERVKYEGDAKATLIEINNAWQKAAPSMGNKITQEIVRKGVNIIDVYFITATLGSSSWKLDDVNGLNSDGSDELFITMGDFIINVGFADDVDANKYAKRLGGMTNPPMNIGDDILGTFDAEIGSNNVEIRSSGTFLSINSK